MRVRSSNLSSCLPSSSVFHPVRNRATPSLLCLRDCQISHCFFPLLCFPSCEKLGNTVASLSANFLFFFWIHSRSWFLAANFLDCLSSSDTSMLLDFFVLGVSFHRFFFYFPYCLDPRFPSWRLSPRSYFSHMLISLVVSLLIGWFVLGDSLPDFDFNMLLS